MNSVDYKHCNLNHHEYATGKLRIFLTVVLLNYIFAPLRKENPANGQLTIGL
jgi:hypothetical protein